MVVLDWLAQVLVAVRDVLVLRTPAIVLEDSRTALPISLGVALLAGLSTMVGHAVVFTLNRIGGLRMAAGMTIGAVYIVLLRLLTAGVLALGVPLVTPGSVDGALVAVVFLVAVAPHALGFLVFVPHLGIGIGRLLEVWSLVALVVLLGTALGLGRWQAIAVGGAAWVAGQLLSRLLARPLAGLSSRAWTLATGHPSFVTVQDILTGAPFVPLERRERV